MKALGKKLMIAGIVSLCILGLAACKKSDEDELEALVKASNKTELITKGNLKIVSETIPENKSIELFDKTRATKINLLFQRQNEDNIETLYKYTTINEYDDEKDEYTFMKNNDGFYILVNEQWIQGEEVETNYADSLLTSYLVDYTMEDIDKISSKKKNGKRVYTVSFNEDYLSNIRGTEEKESGVQQLTYNYVLDKAGYINEFSTIQKNIMTVNNQTDTITLKSEYEIIRIEDEISFDTKTNTEEGEE